MTLDFTTFRNLLPKLQNAPLLAEAAHAKMSPPERIRLMGAMNWETLQAKEAAVMLLVYPRNDKPTFVLILRNTYNGVHSAQVGLPGGKRELVDASFAETALRETFEEVGVTSDQIEIVRELSKLYIPPSNFIVYPFFGVSDQELIFKPDPREVAGLIEFGIDDLLNDTILTELSLKTSYAIDASVPAFAIQENIVWGATAMIISEFRELLKTAVDP